MSNDLMSGYYHVGLFQASRTYVGFKWGGKYYVYKSLLFGLSTAPFIFSKVMRDLAMYWRRRGIRVFPYPDDSTFIERGCWQVVRLARWVEKDIFLAGLKVNVSKWHLIPAQQRRQLGSDVYFVVNEVRVPEDRWEALWRRWAGRYPPTREEWWPAH